MIISIADGFNQYPYCDRYTINGGYMKIIIKILITISCFIIYLFGLSLTVKAAPYAGITKVMSEMIQEISYLQTKEHITMYASTRVNVRKEANTKSDILTVLDFNEPIEVYEKTGDWYKVEYQYRLAYINANYLTKEKKNYKEYNIEVPIYFKSYTDYRCITSVNSAQYKLQRQYAYDGNYGIRMVNDRYCVAIGSRFDCDIGQYFDILLENGTVIQAIKSDEKADKHTDSTGTYTCVTDRYCATEFTVNTSILNKEALNMGDLSYANPNWNSKVVTIRVYDKCVT